MKIVFVISMVVALAMSHAELEKEQQECLDETGLTEAEVLQIMLEDDDTEKDAKATKYLVCIFKKNEAINDEGRLDVTKAKEAVKNYMKEVGGSEDQQALDCVQEKDTIEETVLALAKCVEKRKVELSSSK